jgi:hypothetical protein
MWDRTMRCACDKKPHATEEDALAQAANDAEIYDAVVTVYRCNGSLAWHTSSRGFLPSSLGHARRLAYEMVLHPGGVHLDSFRTQLGQDYGSAAWRKTGSYAARMKKLGVLRDRPSNDTGRPTGWLELVNEAGARRIVQIGIDGYAEEAEGA